MGINLQFLGFPCTPSDYLSGPSLPPLPLHCPLRPATILPCFTVFGSIISPTPPATPNSLSSRPRFEKNLCKTTISGASRSTTSRVPTKQLMEGAPISRVDYHEPDIIYVKLPIINPVDDSPAHCIKASAKLPDDGQHDGEQARIPIAMTDFVEITSDRPTANKTMSSTVTAAVAPTDERATFSLDDKVTNGKVGSSSAEAIEISDEVSNEDAAANGDADSKTCTTIETTSTVTVTAFTDESQTNKITVDTNRKPRCTRKQAPNTEPSRLVVNAPVEIKVILQAPASPSNSKMTSSTFAR